MISEDIDESETFSIQSIDHESADSHPSYTEINDQIWSDINAEPPASITLLQPEERHIPDDDKYFAGILDTEFLSKWNIGPQLTLKQSLMFERYLKQFRDIYAFKREPLGKVTVFVTFPVPRIDEALSLMRDCDTFSVQDAQSCFWQIQMHPKDQEKTTFVCHLGTFMFRVMPFGLTGAPASCNRTMTTIFAGLEGRISFIYMDDLVCYSKGVEEHLRRLVILAKKCLKYGLKMSAEKCTFGFPNISYLGHIISEKGISPDIERHRALLEKPEPNNLSELESFLGFMVYWRTYVPNFSVAAEPLYRMLRGKRHTRTFIWGREQRKAYKTLVDYILSGPILVHFDPTAELELRCDASNEGVGAILIQIKNKISGILCCASRTLSECETNYPITKKECLAIIFGIRKFRPYLYGRFFAIVTDHCALCYLLRSKELGRQLAVWCLELSEFDFEIR